MMSLFGQGFRAPLRATSAGRLELTSGEERVWQSVEEILRTPVGTRALDPTFGVELQAYDITSSATAVAWSVARAIERCEPRVADIEVTVLGSSAEGTVSLRLGLVLEDGTQTDNRVFPIYRRS